jgi:hypothetical protein
MLLVDDTGHHRYFDLQFQVEDDQVFNRTRKYWQHKLVQSNTNLVQNELPPQSTIINKEPSPQPSFSSLQDTPKQNTTQALVLISEEDNVHGELIVAQSTHPFSQAIYLIPLILSYLLITGTLEKIKHPIRK